MDARFDVPFGAQCSQLQQLAIDSEITELKTEGKRSTSVIVLFHGNHVVFTILWSAWLDFQAETEKWACYQWSSRISYLVAPKP